MTTNVFTDVNHTTLILIAFTLSDPQYCSIGQLKWPLNESDRINGGGGTYFLPDEVSCNGKLVSVQTCFFYNDGGNRNKKNFRLHVGVFRRIGETYLLDEWIVINAERRSNSETQDCELKNLPDPVQVREGDRIAVRVKKQCNKKQCPLQPNLNGSGSTSVFFTQAYVDTIQVSQVMATKYYTNVFLDVSASIGKLNGQ